MAGAMRLFQHDEFPNIVAAAAAARSLDEALVEKDYYITEILRIIAGRYQPGQMIFKGGTSLSKAWGLIERLSEDVDLLLVPERFEPRLSRRRVDAELAALTEAIATHPGLELDGGQSERVAGRARSDWFAFVPRFARIGIAPSIMTEPGTRGGTSPTTEREISSVVGRFLQEAGQGAIAEDLDSFPMTVLHFRRTFVEKLFVVHSLVERLVSEDRPLGRDARHYIDLYVLAGEDEVQAMLRSPEYQAIKEDYEGVSLKFFKKGYRRPPGLSFAGSAGVFPGAEVRAQIAVDYDEQCQILCYGAYPSFDEIVGRFEEIRDIL
jgi:hypothetical protein